jgi:hypothetical protein
MSTELQILLGDLGGPALVLLVGMVCSIGDGASG